MISRTGPSRPTKLVSSAGKACRPPSGDSPTPVNITANRRPCTERAEPWLRGRGVSYGHAEQDRDPGGWGPGHGRGHGSGRGGRGFPCVARAGAAEGEQRGVRQQVVWGGLGDRDGDQVAGAGSAPADRLWARAVRSRAVRPRAVGPRAVRLWAVGPRAVRLWAVGPRAVRPRAVRPWVRSEVDQA